MFAEHQAQPVVELREEKDKAPMLEEYAGGGRRGETDTEIDNHPRT